MLNVCQVLEQYKKHLPGITHLDGTARVQSVIKDLNYGFYNLLECFEEISSFPILLNTSFNLKGEPIVNSPLDALNTFDWCDIDF